ncbi:MAG: hypothetical protein J3K34DRAFT_428725 [Monoraphidium minutum]|nr:MAG: hypothetical protein J3K34DRAFT_428725 [Monoraphidium minutum]
MGRLRPTLVQRMLRLVEHERFEAPKAWPVLTRFRPAELTLQHRAPPAMEFTHNTFYRHLYKRYPEVRMAPFALNLPHPSLARRFVSRQVELMRGGLEQRAAFRAVEGELRSELGALKHESAAGGFVGYIQSQEETALQQAVRALVKRQVAAGKR